MAGSDGISIHDETTPGLLNEILDDAAAMDAQAAGAPPVVTVPPRADKPVK